MVRDHLSPAPDHLTPGAGLPLQPAHAEGRNRSLEALEVELADRLGVDQRPGLGVDALADEDLAGGGLGAEAGGEVGHAADGAVVEAALEADGADGRVALRDAH